MNSIKSKKRLSGTKFSLTLAMVVNLSLSAFGLSHEYDMWRLQSSESNSSLEIQILDGHRGFSKQINIVDKRDLPFLRERIHVISIQNALIEKGPIRPSIHFTKIIEKGPIKSGAVGAVFGALILSNLDLESASKVHRPTLGASAGILFGFLMDMLTKRGACFQSDQFSKKYSLKASPCFGKKGIGLSLSISL